MENTHFYQKKQARIVIVALLLIFIGMGAILFAYSQKNTVSTQANTVTFEQNIQPTPVTKTGEGTVLITSTTERINVSNTITTSIAADSNTKDVAGFDILLSYDPERVRVNQVVTVNPNFQISSFTKRLGIISITGTKATANQSQNIFSNTKLVDITFTALKAGKTEIAVKNRVNNEVTKFIDVEYKQLLPENTSLQLEIL